jgi:adsorption protein B
VLSLEQLQACLDKQVTCGKRLGELLLDASMLSTESLADAIAEQADLPRVSLGNVAVGHFADSLAFELQYAYRAIPFSTADDGTLNIAVGRPAPPGRTGGRATRRAQRRVLHRVRCGNFRRTRAALALRRDLAATRRRAASMQASAGIRPSGEQA